MFNINFYTFSKAKNSTKRPEGDGVPYQCELIQGTSTYSPSITLNLGVANVSRTNYCYIPELGRYYFVTNWSWEDGLWSADLETDVLATWKIDIGNLTAYVLRSASEYDGYIQDGMYPFKTSLVYYRSFKSSGLVNEVKKGCFVVGMLSGNTGGNVGAVTYYAFTSSEFGTFIDALMGDSQFQIEDISEGLYKSLFNPFQYIVSCVWLPIDISKLNTVSTQICKIGWWTIATLCRMVSTDSRVNIGDSLLIYHHPQSASGKKYLNTEPYMQMQFSLWPFGVIDLHGVDPDANTIGFNILLDAYTGVATLTLSAVDPDKQWSQHLVQVQGQLGVPVQLSQNTTGVLQGVVGAIGATLALGGGLALGAPALTIAGVTSAIQSAVDTIKPNVQSLGSSSGIATTGIIAELLHTYREVVDEDKTDKGRPLCKVRKLNTLYGYIQCSESEYNLPCYGAEYDAISAYLSGGFFYE